jgi:molybdenum cofactor guanylyltransferase
MQVGGIVLCGGRSSRMGRPKACLPFGPEQMLQRVVRLLGSAVQPLVVVAALGQRLPSLPPEVQVAHDRREGCGPLEGLAAGLAAIQRSADGAYVTGCDVPLLVPDFVRDIVRRLERWDVVVPTEGDRHHPLAAAYRTSLLPEIESLLAAGRWRPVFLYDVVRTERVPVEQLRTVDPELRTLANLNQPADYRAALAAAGFTVPEDMHEAGEGGPGRDSS